MKKFSHCALYLGLVVLSANADAAITSAGIMDDALMRYSSAASTWGAIIKSYATWLFWTLALISMVWTFGMMALRKADIAEFYAEVLRFIVFTGFFFWLLTNGPQFAMDIQNSLTIIGSTAANAPQGVTPSGIVDVGFSVFDKVYDNSSGWPSVDKTIGVIIAIIILIVLALVAVNMLILMITGWILAYAGIFFLGFGGSRWTSDMAISYYKTVLSIGAQLLTMVLLVGIGQAFIDNYYLNMSPSYADMNELAVVLVASVILLSLVNKVPPLIGQIPMGGGTGAIGNGFGAGSAIAAGAAAGAAMATAASMMGSGAANIGGGASALMAAFNQANNSINNSGGGEMSSPSSGTGGGSSSGGSPLAMAMDGSSPPSAGSSPSSSTSGGSSSKGSSVANAGKVAAGTVSNLFQGGKDVAKEAIQGRISNTVGGKIAEAINTRAEANNVPITESNSLSAGSEQVDREAEIAAFVNREA
jgi:type IV secretion system protein TrbL